MKLALLISTTCILSLVVASTISAGELSDFSESLNRLPGSSPPIDANLSREVEIKALAYERQILTLDHQQLRLLDALASSSPFAARSMVNGIKAELNYLEARDAGQSFASFLSNVPLGKRGEALKTGLDIALSLAPEYSPLDATGVTTLEAVERFGTGPIATFRYYLPDTKLEEETLQRLKLPNNEYLRFFRDHPDQRRLLALRLSVIDEIANDREVTRNELRLLPYRLDVGFMQDDVDDVVAAIGSTAVAGNPLNNDLSLLTSLFSDLDSQVDWLSGEFRELGLDQEAAQFSLSYENAKRAYLGAANESVRAEAHTQMLSTLNTFQSRLLYRAIRNGPNYLSSDDLNLYGRGAALDGTYDKIPIPKDFESIKISGVDLSDWSDETWAQSLKLANNSTTILRNIAVLAGDDETALQIRQVATGIELTAQMYRGLALMGDASEQALSTASAASFLGGAGLVVGAFVAIQSMSEANAEAEQFERLEKIFIEIFKVARATLQQSEQNQTYILALGIQIDELEEVITHAPNTGAAQCAVIRPRCRGTVGEPCRTY